VATILGVKISVKRSARSVRRKAFDRRRRQTEQRALARVPQADRGVVEQRRQLRGDVRSMQLERWRLDRRADHLDAGRDQLDAVRRLLVRHNLTLHTQHTFGLKRRDARHQVWRLQHHLGQPRAVAQDQKRDLAQPPQAVQPAGQHDTLADMRRQFNGPDPLHDGDTSAIQHAPVVSADEEAFITRAKHTQCGYEQEAAGWDCHGVDLHQGQFGRVRPGRSQPASPARPLPPLLHQSWVDCRA